MNHTILNNLSNSTTTELANSSINSTLTNSTQSITETGKFIIFEVPFSINPFVDILIISIVAALFTTILNKYLTDQVAIKALRAEMKKKQKNMREMMKTNPQKAQAMQGEIMKQNMDLMKQSFNIKVIAITLLPLLYVFTEIRSAYAQYDVIMDVGLFTFGWLGSYIVLTLIASIIIKKLLKVA
ncbi:MAG: hypothetical protein ACLFPL_02410 [Candidatus Nanoarchaeia archaeon]